MFTRERAQFFLPSVDRRSSVGRLDSVITGYVRLMSWRCFDRDLITSEYICVCARVCVCIFMQEREAAARAYASCVCLQRRSSANSAGFLATLPPPPPPQTLDELTALASALLPSLTWDNPGWAVAERNGQQGSVGGGYGNRTVETFLEATLSKVQNT